MIFLDIDDTLINYSDAEKKASSEFGKMYSSLIPDYNILTFSDIWHANMEKYYQEFLNGKLSYIEQRRNRIKAIFKNDSIEDTEADELYSVYKKFYQENWQLFDDVLPFLDKYKNEGFIAITDGQQSQQEQKLKDTGIVNYFQKVVSAESTKSCKPNKKIFQVAIDSSGLKHERCIYVGDNLEKDAIGANNAGLIGVWLNRNGIKLTHSVIEIKSLNEFEFCLTTAST